MSTRWALLLAVPLLAGCVPEAPAPVVLPPVERVIFLPGVREQAPDCLLNISLPNNFGPFYGCPPPKPPRHDPPPAFPPAEAPPPVLPPPVLRPAKAAKPVSPTRIIAQAHDDALIMPTPRGYHGGTVEQRYTWQPGKLYAIYTATTGATSIYLPVGEHQYGGLSIPGEDWELGSGRIGKEDRTQDIVTLYPKAEGLPPVNVILFTEEGRTYNLRLIVGKTPMTAVRFELPLITRIEPPTDDPLAPQGLR